MSNVTIVFITLSPLAIGESQTPPTTTNSSRKPPPCRPCPDQSVTAPAPVSAATVSTNPRAWPAHPCVSSAHLLPPAAATSTTAAPRPPHNRQCPTPVPASRSAAETVAHTSY